MANQIHLARRTGIRPSEPWYVMLGVLLCSSFAHAQSDEAIEEIVVTGSRLARDPNLAGPLPVQTVNADTIRLSGEFEVSDVINDLPALATSSTSEQSFGVEGFTGIGTNILSLRGLGNERTLVLVNGRRHVAGLGGTGAVDVGSIPASLIERVEVLTGGASAVYGADAVTGVVNFITRDDYEGFSISAQTGLSDRGDGEQLSIAAAFGRNFAANRGNIAITVDYQLDKGLLESERSGRSFASAIPGPNPDLRFQNGEVNPSTTPNIAAFLDFANTGLYPYGLEIPSQDDFVAFFTGRFGSQPDLTDAERELFERAANAPPQAILPEGNFFVTSAYGRINAGNPFTFAGFDPLTPIDLDNNGTPDCLDSFTGYNASFAPAAFGALGGCWNISPDGTYSPASDGLISDFASGYGGQGFDDFQTEPDEILLGNERVTVNLMGHLELTDRLRTFAELKFARQDVRDRQENSFFIDNALGAADNPFLPTFIQPLAQSLGGVAITVDPVYNDPDTTATYTTTRAVIGLEGELDNGWSWETSANYGRYEQDVVNSNRVILDRWFAAIDAVTDPATGEPACRSEVDPNAPLTATAFNFPEFDPGYFTFTPGSGSCVPLNIWAGRPGVSAEAIDWVTTALPTKNELEQFVVTGFLRGNTEDRFELPGGPLTFVAGAEFRYESSSTRSSPLELGVLPPESPFPQGTNIFDVSENNSPVFPAPFLRRNEEGSYDAFDAFFEVAAPIVTDRPGARELSVEAAVRQSEYSTIGGTTTWKASVLYAPTNSVAFRASQSRAVRAPNITELFSPESTTSFLAIDPCDTREIAALAEEDPGLAVQTQANCSDVFESIGLDPFDAQTGEYAFIDPNQAAIIGIDGGNRNLREEEADTTTIGVAFQPEWLNGLSVTIDYWDIEIQDAIDAAFGDDIVAGCYVGDGLDGTFCDLTGREDNPTALNFGGINFIRSTNINFVAIESAGVDFDLRYQFSLGDHALGLTVAGSWLDKVDFLSNPVDSSDRDDRKGEFQRPEWAGNIFVDWARGDFTAQWQARYVGEQLLPFPEIENYRSRFGTSVLMDAVWVHDLSARWHVSNTLQIFGGVKNVNDEMPFITDRAYPASARGRYFFVGVDYAL